jgi:hypothetical protein
MFVSSTQAGSVIIRAIIKFQWVRCADVQADSMMRSAMIEVKKTLPARIGRDVLVAS